MRVVVLGSAAGGGYPQWNCRCGVCALAWRGDPRVRPGTQSSLALIAEDGSAVLVNASPDLGQQIRQTPALWPARGRHSPIAAVVLTSAEIDHTAGLLSLRERHPFRLVALPRVHDVLAENPMFAALPDDIVPRVRAKPGESIAIAPGLSIELFAVPGKAPLYLEGADPAIGGETGETAGLFARAAGACLAYVPGCAVLDEPLLARLRLADILLFDGTLFSDDEMIAAGLGAKTGRRMGHVPIGGEGGSLAALPALPARRKIYVHINNSNPVWIDGSPERVAVERAGLEVAHDGMEVAL